MISYKKAETFLLENEKFLIRNFRFSYKKTICFLIRNRYEILGKAIHIPLQ